MSTILFKVKAKLEPNQWVTTSCSKKNPIKKDIIYNATQIYSKRSLVYNIIRDYIVLEEYPYLEFTLEAFDIIPNDNIGERAPKCDITPQQTYNITRKEEYKLNHIF